MKRDKALSLAMLAAGGVLLIWSSSLPSELTCRFDSKTNLIRPIAKKASHYPLLLVGVKLGKLSKRQSSPEIL